MAASTSSMEGLGATAMVVLDQKGKLRREEGERRDGDGLVPHETRKYRAFDIGKAITDSLGVQVTVYCNRNFEGYSQFYEVRLCYHKNATLMSCRMDFSNCLGVRENVTVWPPPLEAR
ncbi:uncharacterized protein LOC119989743 isoform X3 [Tripterygium wilfordii]|uniref:uncharacterized protein LOC119989743 isoform X3 n=1 Tax=Tripterygium wilfordii TaxID=458696 RepID=UPI0018F81887|nr:uncharacterized protein LOC119989743 isoform X3 [Tripterygium wilfordii]